MTRRSITTALGSLLVALVVTVQVPTVSADSPCTGYAPEHCEEVAAATDAALLSASPTMLPVHILSSSGVGQEHFEATQDNGDALYIVAAPSAATVVVSDSVVPGNDEQVVATPRNLS